MKVYISGKISGLPYQDVKEKFERVERLIQKIGLSCVNPLNNGLSENHTWAEHMAIDIKLLLTCDAIILLNNWEDSMGARIEHYVAKEKGLAIWHESYLNGTRVVVPYAIRAVQATTGVTIEQIASQSRKQDVVFARMIFAKLCSPFMRNVEIGEVINRARVSILHSLNTVENDMKYIPILKKKYEEAEYIMNEHLAQQQF